MPKPGKNEKQNKKVEETPALKELTANAKAFADFYLMKPSLTWAAKKAGLGSEGTHGNAGWEQYQKPEVRAYIETKQAARAERLEYTQDEIVSDLIEVKDRCLVAEAIRDHEGNETGEWKFDSKGALRALELLGKHVGMWKNGAVEKLVSTLEDLVAGSVEGE